MPAYVFLCDRCGLRREVIRSMAQSNAPLLCACDYTMRRDYKAERKQVGMVDGEHSGYYPKELGFPRDPRNPAKRICPSKRAAMDAFKRAEVETRGRVAWAESPESAHYDSDLGDGTPSSVPDDAPSYYDPYAE